MDVSLFDFELPEDRIALRPVVPRDAARMLVVEPDSGKPFRDATVRDLSDFLAPGDVLVLNDTKVIPARLDGIRHREGGAGARIEANLIERLDPSTWLALAKPAKRLATGDRITFGEAEGACLLSGLAATVAAKGESGEITLAFDLSGPALDEAIMAHGAMPLPPYIAARRPADDRDLSDYQTTYARHEGAVAAPTAGLHLTPELLRELEERGVSHQSVTLHVGAGTFLPVKAEDTDHHRMHAEHYVLSAETAAALNAARAAGGRIVAVGTTALRVLESVAAEDGRLEAKAGETDIFITPGYRFRCVDALITNFHLPRSTLFMLVSAFAGLETMRAVYRHAIETGYRFYSYGDASLLFRPGKGSIPS